MITSEPRREVHTFVDHLFRHQAGQMVASLTRIFGLEHLDLVEDAVQDALVRALKIWPYEGVPGNPPAWLIQVAKNRLLDRLRRRRRWRQREAEVERSLRRLQTDSTEVEISFPGEVRDDQLRMIFTCCHPAIPRDGQVALTLKTVGGFSSAEIARAFLAREATVAQRLVRAKRTLRDNGVHLAMPPPAELPARLDAVLEVLYLLFNEGYSALEGEALVRRDLCAEAVRLAELLAEHPLADVPKVHALAALLLFQASRLPARTDAAGELLLLSEQDRSQWGQGLIARGFHRLRRSARGEELSQYHLEAEIASCHAVAPSFEDTDWVRILACYDVLFDLSPSPVVAVNRTVALAQVEGAEAALAALDGLAGQKVLQHYYPFWATRGEVLRRLGRGGEAVAAYRAALALTSSQPVRRFLEKRLQQTGGVLF